MQQYRLQNRLQLNAYRRDYMRRNKKKQAAWDHARYLRKRDKISARSTSWARRNKDKIAAARKKTWLKHKSKYLPRKLARNAVRAAIKAGRIVRQSRCPKCKKKTFVQAHHHNGYGASHRFDVVWLCHRCHCKAHRVFQ